MASTLLDIADDLDDAPTTDAPAPAATPAAFSEACSKCGGSGAWRAPSSLGHQRCTLCKGTGRLSYKRSAAERAKARVQRAAREERRKDKRLTDFEAEYPHLATWWTGSDFPFAVAMREAVRKWGHLTENQLAAAERAAAKLLIAQDERAAREANAKAIDIRPIEQVFAAATGNGLRRPLLRLAGFQFSLAKADGRNAGAIYVKQDGAYLGKVMEGRFTRSRDCGADQEAEILRVAAEPKDAAIAYGRLTGACAVCGRTLDNKESVARGIGPICAEKFGW